MGILLSRAADFFTYAGTFELSSMAFMHMGALVAVALIQRTRLFMGHSFDSPLSVGNILPAAAFDTTFEAHCSVMRR